MTQPALSARLLRIKPSPSMAAKALVDKLRAEGRKIVDFTLGEPDLPTPPHIVEAAIAAMRRGETRYTGAAGTPALRRAIATKLARDNHLDYRPEEIVVGCGGKHIIYHALAATLGEGDEVIVPKPYWVSYPDISLLTDATPIEVTADRANGLKLTADALEAAITPRTRWVILNTPNNPSGAVYSRDELLALAEVLRRHEHVLLLSDEIYEHFVYDGGRHVSPAEVAPDLKDRILVVNGASKGYCMTGWRLGYGAGPKFLVDAITKLVSQTTTCPNAIAQAAAIEAFTGDQAPVHAMVAIFKERRDRIVAGLARAAGLACTTPHGAFYVFPSVAGLIGRRAPDGTLLATDTEVANYLLREVGVATVDGASYGMSPYLRLSFATSLDAIDEGCGLIAEACSRLRPSR
jgi:aspartate aminotransferase